MYILSKKTLMAVLMTAFMPMIAQSGSMNDDQDETAKLLRNDAYEKNQGDHRYYRHHPHPHPHHSLRIALWGDEFYNDDPTANADAIAQTIDSMNAHHLDFTIFVGDTKNGHSLCTDRAIGQDVVDIFNRLDAPSLYSVGDNEWTDCHRISNGGYDPVERLDYLRTIFFDKDTTQGIDPITVERQGELGQAYSENSRFEMNHVEFVALHIPGSNNNLVATKKQCTKKSNRTQEDCAAATAEYRARNAMNIAWLKDSFARARENNYAGVLIAIQADIFFPFELSDGGYQKEFLPQLNADNGYADFFYTLVEETHNYDGQVVLVHGDSHYFKVDKAMFNDDGTLTANFTRIEVFGSKDNSWVEMIVDPSSENVFYFKPVIVQ